MSPPGMPMAPPPPGAAPPLSKLRLNYHLVDLKIHTLVGGAPPPPPPCAPMPQASEMQDNLLQSMLRYSSYDLFDLFEK